ncbi:MAG TPA: hypothetical protein ENK32_01140 [Anaerolineae bacterium]|nr:hypothetical protein [Anaerolineae bacterium]
MNRTISLLFPAATGLIFSLLLFTLLAAPFPPQSAQALPPGHPPINTASITQIPSTPLDFFQPGTQPNTVTDAIDPPNNCKDCHANYSSQLNQPADYEPWTGWQGSMMAQAGRDPVFLAALAVANNDAANAGDFCLRCHMPRAFFDGRIANGQLITDPVETARDLEGVQCEVCHRLVDPVADPANPNRDPAIIAALTSAVYITSGNAAMILDPEDYRRGPFDVNADWGRPSSFPHFAAKGTLQSPYHQEAALCGACHDISNPLLSWDDGQGEYTLNSIGAPFTDTAKMFPLERTYSEWRLSAYNSPQGVYAPQFGGNKSSVSTCQDCHMRDVTGAAANFFGNTLIRNDMPLHDLTGANTWVPQILPLHPVFSDTFKDSSGQPNDRAAALQDSIVRAQYMLQNAASLSTRYDKTTHQLTIRVTNQTGHKLPTGYPEGRRIWLQVEGYDSNGSLIYTSGAYNNATGDLTLDANIKVYEILPGVTGTVAISASIPPGPTFHFALNNTVFKDNRIPPRGYNYAAFAAAGAAPVTNAAPDPARYADGQYWDDTVYPLPPQVVTGTVRLLYQTSSKEYIEFLRDNGGADGQILFDLWQASNRSAPELMAAAGFGHEIYLPLAQK